MSKLEELIQQLCPDGVEYKHIGSISEIGTGSSNSNEASEDGKYPFFIRSQTIKLKNDYEYDDESIIIPGEGDIGEIIHYINGKYALHQRVYRIHFFTNNIITKFAYYYMQAYFKPFIRKRAVSATVTSIRKPMLEQFPLPIPPLAVQKELVRILDQFTELTTELTVELTARKKQYEYYQQKLFAFDDNTEWTTLSRIADIGTGNSNTNEELENGKYPFFVRSQEVRRKNTYEYDETAIITSGDGVGVGKIFHYIEGKYALHQRAYRIHITDKRVLPKFYFYYMKSSFLTYIEKTSFHSSVTSIRRPMLNNFPVPILDTEDQRRIVSILDKFDALCNDPTSGLPAEITARQKQYEYYRDKLLTFKKKASDSVRGE